LADEGEEGAFLLTLFVVLLVVRLQLKMCMILNMHRQHTSKGTFFLGLAGWLLWVICLTWASSTSKSDLHEWGNAVWRFVTFHVLP
jgi:hypothetical protein